MKATFLFFIFCALTTIGNSQTKYTVKFESSLNSKEVVHELTLNIKTYNRYVIDSSTISFYSKSSLSDEFFYQKNSNYLTIHSITRQKNPAILVINEKVGGNNCEQAEILCSNTPLAGNSGGFGTQELNNSNNGCLNENENQSSWYYINVQTSGVLNFRINPNTNVDDYDFALWGPFTGATAGANCPPLTPPVRCNFSSGTGNTGISAQGNNNSVGAGGSKWSNELDVLGGEIYILLIDNYSISSSGYNLDFSWGANNSTAVLGCIPVVLPIELLSFNGTTTQNENILAWTTLSEINNDFFTIEHSTDGINWSLLTEINGAGNTSSTQNYTHSHSNFRNLINYYRLSQTDFDGHREYFSTIALDNIETLKEIIRVTNILGQEVTEEHIGMKIIVYSDGSILKKF